MAEPREITLEEYYAAIGRQDKASSAPPVSPTVPAVAPQQPSGDPLAGAAVSTQPASSLPAPRRAEGAARSVSTPGRGKTLSEVFNNALPEEGLGLPEETLKWLGKNNWGGVLGAVGNAPAGAVDSAVRGLQVLEAAGITGAEAADRLAEETGIADVLSWDGNKFLPGSGFMALAEAFPFGLDAGGISDVAEMGIKVLPSSRRDITPDVAQSHADTIAKMVEEKRPWDEINKYVVEQGYSPYGDDTAALLQEAQRRVPLQFRTPEEELLVQQAIQKTADTLGIPDEAVARAVREPDFQSQVKMTLGQEGVDPTIVDKPTNPKFIQGANDVESGGAAIAPDPLNPIVPPVEQPDVVTRLTEALKNAGKAREEQDLLYKQERSKRFAAAADAQQNLAGMDAVEGTFAALKGEMPKAEFEAVIDQFSQDDINSLLDSIRTHETLTVTGKTTAYKGFLKLMNGNIPTPSELSKLSEVFPSDLIKAALSNRSAFQQLRKPLQEVWNLPKSLMSTMDLSAPLRQGIGLVHRKEWKDAFKEMHKYLVSEDAFTELETSIKTRPSYEYMERAKLSLPGVGDTAQEVEDTFSSHIAQRLWGVGKINKASERAYVGFLNKLRADTFDNLLTTFKDRGVDIEDPDLLKSLGRYINASTGRGDLGKLEAISNELNMAFFSPRLLKSRVDMMLNPLYYKNLHPEVRKEAFKSAASVGAYWASMAGLAGLAGATIETDPRSSDFMKGRFGNTRLDFSGGFGPLAVLSARVFTKEAKSLKAEEIRELERMGDKPTDAAAKFLRSKLAPTTSLFLDAYLGEDYLGKKFHWGPAIVGRSVPMSIPEILKEVKERGPAAIPFGFLALYGQGLQSFDSEESEHMQYPYPLDQVLGRVGEDERKDGIKEITLEEYQAITSGKEKPDDTKDVIIEASTPAEGAVLSVFPGARITSTHRGENHPLSLKNPSSSHIGYEAVDIAPIKGVSFEEFIKTLSEAGFKIKEKRNEVGKGKVPWATGDHWHVVIDTEGWEEISGSE